MSEMHELRASLNSDRVGCSLLLKKNSCAVLLLSRTTGHSWEVSISDGTTLRQLYEWLGIVTLTASMSSPATDSASKPRPCSPHLYDLGPNGSPGLGPTMDYNTIKALESSLQ